jgi:toxin ParE1/3/4
MSIVVYSAAADEDLADIAAYIARDKPSAARRWVQTIREKCELLAGHPMMGEERPGFGVPGCRSFSVGNYVLFFRPIENGIEVARIVHGSRDLYRFED